jgi:hypothetical protein
LNNSARQLATLTRRALHAAAFDQSHELPQAGIQLTHQEVVERQARLVQPIERGDGHQRHSAVPQGDDLVGAPFLLDQRTLAEPASRRHADERGASAVRRDRVDLDHPFDDAQPVLGRLTLAADDRACSEVLLSGLAHDSIDLRRRQALRPGRMPQHAARGDEWRRQRALRREGNKSPTLYPTSFGAVHVDSQNCTEAGTAPTAVPAGPELKFRNVYSEV